MDKQVFTNVIWGQEMNEGEISAELLKKHITEDVLYLRSKNIRDVPVDDIIYILEKVGQKISDKGSEYFAECVELLPSELNYSKQMVEYGLELFRIMLKRKSLVGRLGSLGDYHSLDSFSYIRGKKHDRVVPLGSICHIASGNIFLGAVDSLLFGILTKNINVLKVSSKDFIFPQIFMRALKEADIKELIYPNISMIYWQRDNEEAKAYIKKVFDAILLFGGEESVEDYKNGLSPRTQMFSFGPKLSFGVVCRGLCDSELKKAARGFAEDIVLWEQKACTSCQNIFIEKDRGNESFISYLHSSLEDISQRYPSPVIDIDSAIEIRKERELAKWKEFNRQGFLLEGKNSCHSIIAQESDTIIDSPLSRTVYVNYVDSYEDILKDCGKDIGYYMSTVSIACKGKMQEIAENFIRKGVMRFCKPGTMAVGYDVEAPHDGIHIADLLVRKIGIEDLESDSFGFEFKEKREKERILLSRINRLLTEALKSPFYKALYKDAVIPINSLEDFCSLPVLNMQDLSESESSMLTDCEGSKYVFSAGGSSGKKKYIWYSADEFEKSQRVFGRGFKGLGISRKDFVINYFRAGALWTGFIATNKGLEETGCKILSLTANQSEEEAIEYIREFKPNTIMSIPGNIILLAQKVKEKGLDICIDNIYYGGDHLTCQAEEYIKEVFKSKTVKSLGYAAVETGPIGFQCEHCKGTEHHIFEDWCYVERDVNGNALITVLERSLHPIIRYRVGDRIEFVNDLCACGRTSPKIKLLSRTDNIIKFNYCDFCISDLENITQSFKELSQFFQIVINPAGHELDLCIKLELQETLSKSQYDYLLRAVNEKIQLNSPALGKNSGLNLIRRLDLNILDSGGIERIERTGKIKKIIDNRLSTKKSEEVF